MVSLHHEMREQAKSEACDYCVLGAAVLGKTGKMYHEIPFNERSFSKLLNRSEDWVWGVLTGFDGLACENFKTTALRKRRYNDGYKFGKHAAFRFLKSK